MTNLSERIVIQMRILYLEVRSDHDTNSEEEATDSEVEEVPKNINNFDIE